MRIGIVVATVAATTVLKIASCHLRMVCLSSYSMSTQYYTPLCYGI